MPVSVIGREDHQDLLNIPRQPFTSAFSISIVTMESSMRRSISLALSLCISAGLHAQTVDQPLVYPQNADLQTATVADFDGDGINEVVAFTGYSATAANAGVLRIFGYDQISLGLYERASAKLTSAYVNRAPLVMVNGVDGAKVAVAANGNQLHTARYDGSTIQWVTTTTTKPSDYLAAVDLDLDGVDEVFSHSWGDGGAVYGFAPSGQLVHRYNVSTAAAGWNDLAVADLTGDSIDDVLVMSGQLYSSPNLSVLPSDGVGGLGTPQTYRVAPNENTSGIAAGDVNGDGRADVVLTRGNNSPTWIWVYTQGEQGELQGPVQVPTYDVPSEAAIVDLDRDGSNEVLVLHDGWSQMSIYRTDTSGVIPEAERIAIPYASYSANAIGTGDLTGDGCPDVVIAAHSGDLQFLRTLQCNPPSDPPSNDLAAELLTNKSYVVVSARSVSGTAPAQAVSADVSLSVNKGNLSVTVPQDCSITGSGKFRCTAASVAPGARVDWIFPISGRRNVTLTAGLSVSAQTADPDASNNTAAATQRL